MFDRSELTRPGSSMTGRPSPGGAFISSGQALGMLAIVPSMRGSSAAHCALEGARGTAAVPEISFAIALMIDGFDGRRLSRSVRQGRAARDAKGRAQKSRAALLVHGRVRTDRRTRGLAHLWLGDRVELFGESVRA